MPTVVFEISGRTYPLPPSAYTSQVCVSGKAPLLAELPPPLSRRVSDVGDKWQVLDRQRRMFVKAFWSFWVGPCCPWALFVAAAGWFWNKWGSWEGQSPVAWGGGRRSRTTASCGTSTHRSSCQAQGAGALPANLLDTLGSVGT